MVGDRRQTIDPRLPESPYLQDENMSIAERNEEINRRRMERAKGSGTAKVRLGEHTQEVRITTLYTERFR
eukprot:8096455-Pyramimonas_sp.AAC.2